MFTRITASLFALILLAAPALLAPAALAQTPLRSLPAEPFKFLSAKEVDALRAAGKPTLPTRMDLELETNPFLRPGVPAIQQRLGMVGKPEWQIFGEIRERKNRG